RGTLVWNQRERIVAGPECESDGLGLIRHDERIAVTDGESSHEFERLEPCSVFSAGCQADVLELLRDVVSRALEFRAAVSAAFQLVGGEELNVTDEALGIDSGRRRGQCGRNQENKQENSAHQAPRAVSS